MLGVAAQMLVIRDELVLIEVASRVCGYVEILESLRGQSILKKACLWGPGDLNRAQQAHSVLLLQPPQRALLRLAL